MFLKSLTIAAAIAVAVASAPFGDSAFARGNGGGGNGGGGAGGGGTSGSPNGAGGNGAIAVDIIAVVPNSAVRPNNPQPPKIRARFSTPPTLDNCPSLTHPSSLTGCYTP
jgi:hypothetical protein